MADDLLLSRWRDPFPLKRFAVMAVALLLLVVACNVVFFVTGVEIFHIASLALVIACAVLFGIFALHSNLEEKTVFKIPMSVVLSKRIKASVETTSAYKGIQQALEKHLEREFQDQYLKRHVFSLLDLGMVDVYIFLGGNLKLYLPVGLGKVILRMEWSHREAREESGKIKRVLKKIDYNKAAREGKTMAFCRKCFMVKVDKDKHTCPSCGLVLEPELRRKRIMNK